MGSRAGAPSPGLRPINAAHSSGSLPPRPAGPSTCARESLPMSCAAHSRLLPMSPIQALPGPAPSSGEGSLRKGSQQAANTACPLLGCAPPRPEPLCRSSMAHDSLRNPSLSRGHHSSSPLPSAPRTWCSASGTRCCLASSLCCPALPPRPAGVSTGQVREDFSSSRSSPGELFPPNPDVSVPLQGPQFPHLSH